MVPSSPIHFVITISRSVMDAPFSDACVCIRAPASSVIGFPNAVTVMTGFITPDDTSVCPPAICIASSAQAFSICRINSCNSTSSDLSGNTRQIIMAKHSDPPAARLFTAENTAIVPASLTGSVTVSEDAAKYLCVLSS